MAAAQWRMDQFGTPRVGPMHTLHNNKPTEIYIASSEILQLNAIHSGAIDKISMICLACWHP